MFFNTSSSDKGLKMVNDEIKRVDDFKYLGSKLASTEADVDNRLSLAWVAYWKLERIWKTKHIPISLKANIFVASVVSVLLYGCEAWTVSKDLEKRLNSFATTCYRMWLGISPLDRVKNEEVYAKV